MISTSKSELLDTNVDLGALERANDTKPPAAHDPRGVDIVGHGLAATKQASVQEAGGRSNINSLFMSCKKVIMCPGDSSQDLL